MENILSEMERKWDRGTSLGTTRELHQNRLWRAHHIPINYSYATLEVESYDDDTDNYVKNSRYFWDGGIMSNTPLTQSVLLHRDYWLKVMGLKDTVPKARNRHSQCSPLQTRHNSDGPR